MGFFSKLFSDQKVECPRCLGKGHVDSEDIRRLKMEFRWEPGKCGYCAGEGKVQSKMIARVDPGLAYLTANTDPLERMRLFDGDLKTVQRANNFELQIKQFTKGVEHLHVYCQLNTEQIAEFYLIYEPQADEKRRKEILTYIQKILDTREMISK